MNTMENVKQNNEGNTKTINNQPRTLFQLGLQLLQRFVKGLIWRFVFSIVMFIVVFIVHTYLMVVVNDTLRVVENNKILSMILHLVPTKPQTATQSRINMLNIYLFWMLISNIVVGTIVRIIAFGIKVFVNDIKDVVMLLFKSIFAKIGSPSLTNILAGSVMGILAGIFVFNNAMCVILAIFLFLSISQKEKSFIVLVMTLTKSDLQRLFRKKEREPLDIKVFSIIVIGISLGLAISGLIPDDIFGKSAVSTVLKVIIVVAFILLGGLNAVKKGSGSFAVFLFTLVGFLLLSDNSVFADDSGWSESGRNLNGWLKNGGTPTALKLGLSPAILSSLANLLGPMFPGFMKDLLKNPNTNPYEYIRNHLTKDQFSKLKDKVQDYHKMQIDAAKADAEAYNSTLGILGNMFEGCGRDFAEIGKAGADFAKTLIVDVPTYVWNNYNEAMLNTGEFIGQCGEVIKGLGKEAYEIAKDVLNHPEILTDTLKLSANEILDDPVGSAKKVAEKIYEMTGLKDIIESTDPNKNVLDRAGLYAMGVIKMWGAVEGAGSIADLTKAGASKLAGLADDLVKAAGGKTPKLTADELKRLFIYKQSQEAGEKITKDFVKSLSKGNINEEQLMQKVINLKGDRNALKALNELKDTNPGAIEAFNKNLKKVYDKVDDATKEALAKKLGCKADDLTIYNPTNKSVDIKAGFDRDITIRLNGKDVPSSKWESIYKEKLYGETKQYFPKGTSADDVMEQLDHTCTDKLNVESYGSSESALESVLKGKTYEIKNAQQVGDAMSYKGLKHFNKADDIMKINPIKAENEIKEGMRQITKQWDKQIRNITKEFGIKPDPNLEKAIKIMEKADFTSPVEVEKALQAIGYTKEEVAKQVGTQFEKMVAQIRRNAGG